MSRGRDKADGLTYSSIYMLSCVSACIAETGASTDLCYHVTGGATDNCLWPSPPTSWPLQSLSRLTDLLKTRLQADKILETSYSGYRRRVWLIAQDIVHQESGGWRNLFRGLTPACLRHLVYSGSRLGIYEYMRESVLEREADGSFPLWKAVLAGMFSGGLAQFLSSPTDLLKVRMQMEVKRQRAGVQPQYSGTWSALSSLLKEGGVRGLWRGWVPNTQRAALVQLGDLTTYDTVKQHLLRDGGLTDGKAVHALSSLCAALMAATLGTPADVIKTRMMNQPHAPTGEGVLYRGSLHCVQCLVKEEGGMALWRGFFLNWLRMAPWSLTFYLSFEQLRSLAGLHTF